MVRFLQSQVSAQRGLEGSHVGSVERLAHGRCVGRHVDEPNVGMRQSMEGQELLTDVPGTHVHEADPWCTVAIGVHDSGVQPCEEGCEGRRRRPMALRVGRGEQRWVVVGGFDGGGLALENELGINEMPGGKEHGDAAARVHDDVLLASGEPPAFEQSMLMMRLRSVIPTSFNVHSIFCWHSSRSVRVVASGHSLPSSPLGFLKEYPSDRMNRREVRALKR